MDCRGPAECAIACASGRRHRMETTLDVSRNLPAHSPVNPGRQMCRPAATLTDLLGRDYELDIGGCISRGWDLLKNNFSLLFIGTLIYLLIEGAIAGFGAIPFIGPLFSIANLFIVGPLMGGVFYIFIQTIRESAGKRGRRLHRVSQGFRTTFSRLPGPGIIGRALHFSGDCCVGYQHDSRRRWVTPKQTLSWVTIHFQWGCFCHS